MYDIKIEEVFNGYIVTIGCQRFVFGGGTSMAASRVELQAALTAYLHDREGVEKAWRKRFGREVSASAHTHTHVYPSSDHRHTFANIGHNHPDHDHNVRPVSLAEGIHHDIQFVPVTCTDRSNETDTRADHDHTGYTGGVGYDFSKY